MELSYQDRISWDSWNINRVGILINLIKYVKLSKFKLQCTIHNKIILHSIINQWLMD